MKALVTGATGFIGYHVMQRLLAEGHEVRVLVRPTSDRRRLGSAPVDVCTGAVEDASAVRRAVAGCGWVFHAAGSISFWTGHAARTRLHHVTGTAHVAAACRATGARLVCTSSVAALGRPRPDGAVGDETTAFDWDPQRHPYGYAKHEAQRQLLAAARDGLDVVIVMPTTTFGACDHNFSAARVIAEIDGGLIMGYPDGGQTVAHAGAVAAGHVAAAARGRRGERYVLGGEHLVYRDLFAEVARGIGRRPPRLHLPRPLMRVLGTGGSVASVLLRRDIGLNRTSAMLGCYRLFYASDKAVRELGFAPRPAREAIAEACEWYLAQRGARAA